MGQKLLPKNRSILFVSLVLGYFVKLHQFLQLQEKLQWHKEDRVEEHQEHLAWNHGWELCAAQAG